MTDSKTEAKGDASLKGKRILVTGGSGYIGSHTIIELLAEGAIIDVLDNLSNSSKYSLERVKEITGTAVPLHIVDLRDYDAVDALFKAQKEQFHAVIHFAGLKAVGESSQIPLDYYENNISGTLNLLKAMRKYEVRRLVFSSSATVYGLTNNVPIKETEPLAATNPYGQTKLMIEIMLRDIAKGKDGPSWKFAILRYFNPIGAHESGLIGEDPKGIPNNLLPYVMQVAVGKLPHLTVFGNDYDTPDGTGVRDYIHVVDLARGHVAALKHGVFGETKQNCTEYNLGTGRGVSVLDLVHAAEKASGKKIEYKVGARRAGDVATCYGDCSKAEKELHWKATLSVERGVADSWRWQSKNPDGFPKDKDAPKKA